VSGAELQRYDYLYGSVTQTTGSVDTSKNTGQVGRVDGTINGSAIKEWDQRLVYDELGRLSTAAEYLNGTGSTPTWQVKYTYDAFGNRKQATGSDNFGVGFTPVVGSEIVDTTNRFINTGSTPTTYDEAGNVKTDTKFRSRKYSYDDTGRQTLVTDLSGNNVQTSVYDAGGQRVQTTASGITRTMVYDIFGQDIADYTGSTLERENIYRGGLLATYEASTYKYVLPDAQGSTRAVMSNLGSSSTVLARHDYLPFGEEISSTTGPRTYLQGYGVADTNRQKYGLTERDSTTNLDHTWFRKYENLSGRWTSPDPLAGNTADPQSLNRYSYVQNDPMNFVDPTGLTMTLRCMVDGVQAYCSAAFALVNMGAGVIYGGTGWYGEGQIFVIDHLYFNDRQLKTWQSIYFQSPQNPSTQISAKEIQRRIDAGKAWDKWQAWGACVQRLYARYQTQRKNYLHEARKQEIYAASIGLVATLIGFGGNGFSVGPLVPIGQIVAERSALNVMDSNYLAERSSECGAEVPKPASPN
jgi:RHS repeat-associated protein